MRILMVFGIILILLGIVSLATSGFSFKSREKVLDVGPIEATAEKERRVNLPPVLGVVALVGGIAMVIAGGKRQ
jgi:uncharacterized membrane protein HdeD (DUF308 family)